MKAVISRNAGGPETLVMADLTDPCPGRGEIRVTVRAVGLNYPDLLIIEDRYQFRPERPFSPGAEIAGIVDAVGEDVRDFAVGDRVLAMLLWGGLAEKVTVAALKAARIPPEMPFDEAAAFLMTYGTAHYALCDRAGLAPGETLLVLGAAGGVGLAAVELGAALGARVIAGASSRGKLDIALRAGATDSLVYPAGPLDRAASKELAARLKDICGDCPPNVIFDPVGGDYSEPALRSIAWEGRYLVVGFPAGIASLPLNLPLLKSCDVRGVFWGAAVERDPARHRQAVGELFALYAAGKIKPFIRARFPLEQTGEALLTLRARTSYGKVVVMIDPGLVE